MSDMDNAPTLDLTNMNLDEDETLKLPGSAEHLPAPAPAEKVEEDETMPYQEPADVAAEKPQAEEQPHDTAAPEDAADMEKAIENFAKAKGWEPGVALPEDVKGSKEGVFYWASSCNGGDRSWQPSRVDLPLDPTRRDARHQ